MPYTNRASWASIFPVTHRERRRGRHGGGRKKKETKGNVCRGSWQHARWKSLDIWEFCCKHGSRHPEHTASAFAAFKKKKKKETMHAAAFAVPLSLWSQVRVLQEPRSIISINRPKGHHLCEFEIDGGGGGHQVKPCRWWLIKTKSATSGHSSGLISSWFERHFEKRSSRTDREAAACAENCLRRQLLYLSNYPHSAYTDTTTTASHTHTVCTVFTSASNRWLSRVLLVLLTTFLQALLSSTCFYKKPLKQCATKRQGLFLVCVMCWTTIRTVSFSF